MCVVFMALIYVTFDHSSINTDTNVSQLNKCALMTDICTLVHLVTLLNDLTMVMLQF